ncbi:MAG: helix-turn-helix domain-containing protein [Haliea sp.]|jgi:AraC-like DNA-binding protein|nr:helix-turn-helix domain-containing protein [Haliea sp.]
MTGNVAAFSDLGFASVPALKQYLQAAETCGVDYLPFLEAANIHPDVLKDNNKRISIKAMERLLALLIPASNDPCFGLHSARFVEPASYSVLGYISMNCSTLRETLANTAIYEKIVGDMGVSSTLIEDGFVLQRWDCRFTHPLVRRHAIENVLGSWQVYVREFAHIDTKSIDCIWLEHSAPADPELLNDYQEVFGCEVHFDQAASGIRFGEEFLDTPLPQANKKLLMALLDHATQILTEIDRDQPITIRVKNLLRLMLKEREPSSTQVAELLNMSSRTLQRKLGAEGTQYQTVLNEVRLELALYYIENTTLSLDQIAHELGYGEARSFYRSFKQWTGRTAGSYRADIA